MGNKISCTYFCKTRLVSSCIAKANNNNHNNNNNNKRVLKVVKIDGNALTFASPILVKDVVPLLSGGVGLGSSKDANSENLSLDYELKIGKVYYELPSVGSVDSLSPISTRIDGKSSGVKRVKVLITKRQLKELLAKQISVDEVLLGLEKRPASTTTTSSLVDRSSGNWKSNLESIPEEVE